MYLGPSQQLCLGHPTGEKLGVHVKTSGNTKDYPTLDYCAIQLQEFPDQLVRFDWDAWDETIPLEERIFQLAQDEDQV